MLKKKINGSWQNISMLKKQVNGAWVACSFAKKKIEGVWTRVYPTSYTTTFSKLNTHGELWLNGNSVVIENPNTNLQTDIYAETQPNPTGGIPMIAGEVFTMNYTAEISKSVVYGYIPVDLYNATSFLKTIYLDNGTSSLSYTATDNIELNFHIRASYSILTITGLSTTSITDFTLKVA